MATTHKDIGAKQTLTAFRSILELELLSSEHENRRQVCKRRLGYLDYIERNNPHWKVSESSDKNLLYVWINDIPHTADIAQTIEIKPDKITGTNNGC